ncbi:hypothetical protein [Photorhabdus temperata]|uniref:DUF350 domain-containing protein n=1 Tax=Photorhabdus temperata TaxID=574560 RepID=UPI001FB13E85|nr:hypothetical protein [Photorhabdus temperata]
MITLADEEQALTQFIDSVTNFGLCFGLALVFFIVFKFIYVMVTPQDEWKLIKEEKKYGRRSISRRRSGRLYHRHCECSKQLYRRY